MNQCSKCGGEMKMIPEGVSRKTGKPYAAFWSCKNCGATAPSGLKPVAKRTFTATKQPNWDAIAEGKVRTHLIGAMLMAGKTNVEIGERLPALIEMAMNGKGLVTREQIDQANDEYESPF